MKTFFITGIGTDVGKTYVTARLLLALIQRQINASSFKWIQTGVAEGLIAPDIVAHRNGSGQILSEADHKGLSCGAQFPYAASPHLAAGLVAANIDGCVLWQRLQAYVAMCRADIVLCEGAGGVFTPLNHTSLTADWLKQYRLPIILVAHAALGSIHQSIATIEAMIACGISPRWVIYNPYPATESLIQQDIDQYLAAYLKRQHRKIGYISLNAADDFPPHFLDTLIDHAQAKHDEQAVLSTKNL